MRRTWLIAALAVAGIVLGIAAEVVADAGLYQAAADLATGWILLACGLWGIHQRPAQGRWLLVAAAGLTWFAGNFSATADLVYLHRGPLVHAVVAATRKRSPLATATVAVGYADGLLVAHANGWLTIAVAVALVALAAHDRPDGRVVGAIAGSSSPSASRRRPRSSPSPRRTRTRCSTPTRRVLRALPCCSSRPRRASCACTAA